MDVDDYDDHCEDLEDDSNNSNNRDEHVLLLRNKGPIAINDISLRRFREMLLVNILMYCFTTTKLFGLDACTRSLVTYQLEIQYYYN